MKAKTKLILRAGLALLAASISATWCLLAASNAQPIVDPAKGVVTDTPAVTPFMDIASAGPLTHVWLGNELSCQVQHVDRWNDPRVLSAGHNSRGLRHVHRHGRDALRARFC